MYSLQGTVSCGKTPQHIASCFAEAAARRVAIAGLSPESPAAPSPGTPSALEVATTGSRRASSDNSVTQVRLHDYEPL